MSPKVFYVLFMMCPMPDGFQGCDLVYSFEPEYVTEAECQHDMYGRAGKMYQEYPHLQGKGYVGMCLKYGDMEKIAGQKLPGLKPPKGQT